MTFFFDNCWGCPVIRKFKERQKLTLDRYARQAHLFSGGIECHCYRLKQQVGPTSPGRLDRRGSHLIQLGAHGMPLEKSSEKRTYTN